MPRLESKVRLKEYAVGHFNGAPTRAAFKKAIKKGLVTVDGQVATTATFVYGKEMICLTIPPPPKAHRELIFPLKVVYEDDHLAMVHKPAGVLVSGNRFVTMARALPQNLKESKEVDRTFPQPVHRLDYPTTGLLLVGKTNRAIRALAQMFSDKQIQKTYFAITIGKMPSNGTIHSPIDGKPAESNYEVVATVPSERFEHLNLVKLTPKTGRRHQLRVHMAEMGNQILGDKEYGQSELVLNGKGLYLHAHSLRFTHPFLDREVFVEDPLPKKFLKIFDGAI